MGLVTTTLTLRNPRREQMKPIEVEALVDTCALHLCVPKHLAIQLELDVTEQREVTLVDGRREKVDYVGPVQVTFENRNCFVGARVMGDQVLLGAVPMEDLDLVVSPARRRVEVNPDSPNIPQSKAM